jgi:hypothetical protein
MSLPTSERTSSSRGQKGGSSSACLVPSFFASANLTAGPLTAGTHVLTLGNGHLPAPAVYLLNAALPRSRFIQITRQTRNANQSQGEIDFTFRPSARPFRALSKTGPTGRESLAQG